VPGLSLTPARSVAFCAAPAPTSLPNDPLGVRQAAAWVADRSRDVSVSAEGVDSVAAIISEGRLPRPSWRTPPHWWSEDDVDATANYVLLLDALNFSFWGEPRWRITWREQSFNGYFALAAALHRAIDEGAPLWDADYLANDADAAVILRGDDGVEIPLLAERQQALLEVGRGLHALGGSALTMAERAEGDLSAFVRLLEEHFPSFRDVAYYEGARIPLYKRAQILVADLAGAFPDRRVIAQSMLDDLTMFADYKVPQVLNELGVLRYTETLTRALARREEMPAGDRREVEIRAGAVAAVEAVREALSELGYPMTAYEIDWSLWALGQGQDWPIPYHRTRTTAY
jgi:hypothetical protein